MATYRVEIDADGICGFNTEIEAESIEDAREIARKQASYIENWEVLSLHDEPNMTAVEIHTAEDDYDEDQLVLYQLGIKGV